LRFSHQNPVCTSTITHAFYMPHPSHPSSFDYPNNIWWGAQIIKHFCSLLHSPVTSFLLGLNILLSSLFSNNFRLCSSRNPLKTKRIRFI
jgi:hypothetical protein